MGDWGETRFSDLQPPSPPRKGLLRQARPLVWKPHRPERSPTLSPPVFTEPEAGPGSGAKPDLGVAARPKWSSARAVSWLGSGSPVLNKDPQSGTRGSWPPSPARPPGAQQGQLLGPFV